MMEINKTMTMSNLSFDHPLSIHEMEDLVGLLSRPMTLGQVYFKDDVDIKTIEQIKLLLEGMPTIDESKIDKYIIKSISLKEKEALYDMSFMSIDTWNIAYSKEDNKYTMTSLSKYHSTDNYLQNMVTFVNEIKDVWDKVCYIYDEVKLFEYSDKSLYNRIPDIISDGKATSYGFNLLFKELLDRIGIKAMVLPIKVDNEESFITLARITSDNETGFYLFDPSLDSLNKNQYKHNIARRMNYNFFAISLSKIKQLNGYNVSNGLMRLLGSDSNREFNHYKELTSEEEIMAIEKTFKESIDNLYEKINNTKEIDDDSKMKIVFNRVDTLPEVFTKGLDFKNAIVDNYKARNSELFSVNPIKKMSIYDNN